jgi:hypothetical protein
MGHGFAERTLANPLGTELGLWAETWLTSRVEVERCCDEQTQEVEDRERADRPHEGRCNIRRTL